MAFTWPGKMAEGGGVSAPVAGSRSRPLWRSSAASRAGGGSVRLAAVLNARLLAEKH